MTNSLTDLRQAFSVYTKSEVLGLVFLGFSAGLPFLLVFSTLSAWLRDEGVTLAVIGYFSWVGVTYSIKVFWAPVVDHVKLPWVTRVMGKRRSWMLLAQAGIVLGLLGLSQADTSSQLHLIAGLAVFIAFCSSTQDIAVDAYRIEAASTEFQGAMAAAYVFGYRVALLVAGAGVFYIAEFSSWQMAYLVMSALMFVGVLTTFVVKEPVHQGGEDAASQAVSGSKLNQLTHWFVDAVINPFVEFFTRNGKVGLLILLLIAVYKLSDITMGVMANPFYLDLGFSKKEIADISKIFGFFMTIAGAALGGIMVVRYGLMRPLLLGAIMVSSTNFLFALLAVSEPDLWLLAGVISADNLSGGIATSVFIAYLSSLTNSAYTATQYALFSSLMTLPAKLLGGLSGHIVEIFGYQMFFIYAAVIGFPAIILVSVLNWLTKQRSHNP